MHITLKLKVKSIDVFRLIEGLNYFGRYKYGYKDNVFLIQLLNIQAIPGLSGKIKRR